MQLWRIKNPLYFQSQVLVTIVLFTMLNYYKLLKGLIDHVSDFPMIISQPPRLSATPPPEREKVGEHPGNETG